MSVDIHISNYEEFLYSYVDGELDAEATAALETFMNEHPQVRQELELLMATRLVPDEMVFSDKTSLYRGSEINLYNYEPFLLNYVDGELDGRQAAAVEEFAAAHPAVQKELERFKAARLQPDVNIRFENKAVLYRHTARVRSMRPAYWWGAAAAVVAGALFFILPADRPVTQSPVATVTPAPPSQGTAVPENSVQAETTPVEKAGQSETMPVAKAPQSSGLAITKPAVRPVTRPAARIPASEDKKDPAPVLAMAAQPEPKKTAADLARISTESPAAPETTLQKVPDNETAINRPPSVDARPEPALATAPPAANPPGELIMSVTGNGLESKVLDKVTNVARLFSRKRNK